MRLAVRLWDALEARNWGRLRGNFQFDKRDRALWSLKYSEAEGELVAPELYRNLQGEVHVLWKLDRRGMELRAARHILEHTINQRLKKEATARLYRAAGGSKLHVVPETLLGAIWLQFALAVADRKRYLHCAQCPNWIEVSPEKHHRPKIYCSSACKMRASRRRASKRRGASPSDEAKQAARQMRTKAPRKRAASARKKPKPEAAERPSPALKKRARER